MTNNLSYGKMSFPHESKSFKQLKELSCINQLVGILKENKSLSDSFSQVASLIPQFWQYPEFAVARIHFDGEDYDSRDFQKTSWRLQKRFTTLRGKHGYLEVYYTREFLDDFEGPFCREEVNLIGIISTKLTGYINGIEARLRKTESDSDNSLPIKDNNLPQDKVLSRQLLQRFINKNNFARDIYHDLMPYKVKEILLVANLYDAYSIEKEGRFSEYVLGEYSSLNLTSIPRITGVSSEKDALEELQKKNYDLVIIMMGTDKTGPTRLSENIKSIFPFLPLFLLLHNNRDAAFYRGNLPKTFDNIFVWNGHSQVFFAMIKMVEDKINLQNDTQKGMTRVILLVEDSPKYYSRYLPMLYKIVMEQTRRIIDDVSTDELYKVLRLRARPKIIHTDNYEDAVEIFNNYKEYMLCLITDVKFFKNGQLDDRAGVNLVKYVRKQIDDLPTIIQSSQKENMSEAYLLQASFIDKNSESLLLDLKNFIIHYLGFGDFIYRDKNGRKIAVARTLREFEDHLATIPDESIFYHATKNHFSLWLMARGEIQVSRIINPSRVTDFKDSKELRKYLIEVMQRFRNEQTRGKIVPFATNNIGNIYNIVKLSDGSLGGKGRGLAFINSLIHNFDFKQILDDINICNPVTYLIGTDEYEIFLEQNNLHTKLKLIHDYDRIRQIFIKCDLTPALVEKLRLILQETTKAIAVRSSGLFEDSLMQPFAGIFDTYILPNNHSNNETRLQQLTDAIKMVYASVYSDVARGYVEAVNYRIDEEKMAVIIQEVVGNQFGDYFYPHLSGVAQSYNYYPVAYMKPEEGFANIAVGLGKTVVDGERSYRFSPKYPDLENYSTKDLFKNSQSDFFAVNLKERELNLLLGDEEGLIRLPISEAEKNGSLKHMASVFDQNNNRLVPSLNIPGPRIVNFANILKYNYVPLAKAIDVILQIGREAIGSPVEIEFALDLNRDDNYKSSLYILQIKPIVGNTDDYNIDLNQEDEKNMVLYTENGLGNGIINHVSDVVYVNPETFDKSETREMVKEIDALNNKFKKLDKHYVLIGPGRWGTRDPWIGIPVQWPHISHAKVIVETSLVNFPLEASSGSHFFHNVTSADVGYLSVQQELSTNMINWDLLGKQKIVEETRYFRHIQFKSPLIIKMDGKKRIAMIHFNEPKPA